MAERAQAVGVRRVTDSVTTPLGVLVQSRLDEHGVNSEELEWDSWRREDARWQVTLAYSAAGRAHTAAWTFDPLRRTIEPADDEARWLTDEERAAPPPAKASGPRLSAVPARQPDVEGLPTTPCRSSPPARAPASRSRRPRRPAEAGRQDPIGRPAGQCAELGRDPVRVGTQARQRLNGRRSPSTAPRPGVTICA